jgi:DNA polymerase alpha-associated DNA helicase A
MADLAQTDISTFAKTQLELLEAELTAELQETASLASQSTPVVLQRAGVAVLNLQLSSQRTGLGGRTVLELEPDTAIGTEIPEHGIRTGDIVGISEQAGAAARKKEKAELDKKRIEGVVTKVTPHAISVAVDKDEVDVPNGKLWLYAVPSKIVAIMTLNLNIVLNWLTMSHINGKHLKGI